MKKRNPFRFQQFEVAQEKAAMPVTTDACIFGASIELGQAKQVLDIGTGTGLLSLMLAQRFKHTQITGIDIHAESVAEANENYTLSPWSERLQAIEANILQWETDQRFDAIISNPPFFSGQLQSEEHDKRRSRHMVSLTYPELINKAACLLNEKGQLWLLIPTLHAEECIALAKINSLYLHQYISIHAYANSDEHVVILHFAKNPADRFYRHLFTYEKQGLYTGEMQYLMRNFYLNKTT